MNKTSQVIDSKNSVNKSVSEDNISESKPFSVIETIIRTFLKTITAMLFIIVMVLIYILGLVQGYGLASQNAEASISQILSSYGRRFGVSQIAEPSVTPTPTSTQRSVNKKITWGGPELWTAVNKRRVENGVNPLNSKSDLCTIASIRLNELLDLKDLDGHVGFNNMRERRPDLKKIFDNYSTVAEFLAMGGESAQETVKMWENTLGHSQLLKAGEYVWGCIYAQDSFAVAITAF